jgi:crotonobetainyl-CoA:carnitine CoA-transferase CaiB-like acyl-CoA transferase
MVQELEHRAAGVLRLLGIPIKLGATPGAVRTPPPTLGEHTDHVLRNDLSVGPEEIERLRRENVL